MGKALKILVAAAMNSNENHHRASFALSQNNQLQQQNKDHSSRPLDVHWFFVVLSSGCPLFFFVGLSVGWSVGCPLAVCWIVC